MDKGSRLKCVSLCEENDGIREAVLPETLKEYESGSLRTPYRILDLMQNRIFGRDNGKFYKIRWISLIYYVAMQGTIWFVQASVHKYHFEELLRKASPKVKDIESQLAKHELNARLLEPVDYRVIREETHAWGIFIKKVVGPT